MAEVFAGFVCGYGLALAVTPLLAIALIRARVGSPLLQRLAPPETNLLALSMVLHTFAFFALTLVGLVLGLMLHGIEDQHPAGGLGSPNGVFTALIIAIAAIAVVPIAIALPRQRAVLLIGGTVFAITFGWLMPYLSLVGPSGS